MSDRRFEERIAELEAEAAESEANAAKWAQEAIDFESELKKTKARLAEAEKERDALSARVRELEGALNILRQTIENVPSSAFHAAFCNGVHADNGMCEGESMVHEDINRAARALKGTT